jgi:TolB-like protein/DNA-binding winged helix-turn-helix (wHTH) protein/cytochrome c-type biogenesis protein CcmH/NrfG
MENKTIHTVRFGPFEFDAKAGELRKGGKKVKLQGQPIQILGLLLEQAGEVITREELQKQLWPSDTFVDFEHSLNAAIKRLRDALDDSATTPRFIETLTRRGYRFIALIGDEHRQTAAQIPIAEITRVDALPKNEGQIPEREPKAPKHWRKAAVMCASAVILVVVGYISWQYFRGVTPPRSEKIMLAVLPFENLTGDADKEYLADGLTEEMISQLGQLNPTQLGVIARTSVMGYKHSVQRLDRIGHDLSVQYVLESSLRQSGNHMRITSQLLRVKDQSRLWSHDYDYRAQDILTVQENVARAVAQEVQLRLTAQQESDVVQSQLVNPEAFDAYLQGHYFYQRGTEKDTDMAARFYERATQLEPGFARAWVGLSRARNMQAIVGHIPAAEGRRLAREAIERALALNPNLAEAHRQVARIKRYVDFDWAGADASIQRAMDLEPGNPDTLIQAASSAAVFGRSDEALELARRAVELDPRNAYTWGALGETRFYEGQLAGAEADVKRSLELDPVWPGPSLLSVIYVMEGRAQDALPEIERVQSDSERTYLYAVAYGAIGREKQSDAALRELIAKYSTFRAYGIAVVYAFRHQSDEAFKWLDRAYAQRDSGLALMSLDPLLKNLHSDPRFAAFLKKLNLPKLAERG